MSELVRNAEAAHARLLQLVEEHGEWSKPAAVQREALRQAYVQAMLVDGQVDMYGPLWLNTSHELIQSCRRALQAQKPSEDAYEASALAWFLKFLANEEAFYVGLIRATGLALPQPVMRQLERTVDLNVDKRRAIDVSLVCNVPPRAIRLNPDQARILAHRIIISIGDIRRYMESYDSQIFANATQPPQKLKLFRRAARCYDASRLLVPSSGHPANQLAVLATYVNDSFDCMYWSSIALCAIKPFEAARANLQAIFEKALMTSSVPQQSSKGDEAESENEDENNYDDESDNYDDEDDSDEKKGSTILPGMPGSQHPRQQHIPLKASLEQYVQTHAAIYFNEINSESQILPPFLVYAHLRPDTAVKIALSALCLFYIVQDSDEKPFYVVSEILCLSRRFAETALNVPYHPLKVHRALGSAWRLLVKWISANVDLIRKLYTERAQRLAKTPGSVVVVEPEYTSSEFAFQQQQQQQQHQQQQQQQQQEQQQPQSARRRTSPNTAALLSTLRSLDERDPCLDIPSYLSVTLMAPLRFLSVRVTAATTAAPKPAPKTQQQNSNQGNFATMNHSQDSEFSEIQPFVGILESDPSTLIYNLRSLAKPPSRRPDDTAGKFLDVVACVNAIAAHLGLEQIVPPVTSSDKTLHHAKSDATSSDRSTPVSRERSTSSSRFGSKPLNKTMSPNSKAGFPATKSFGGIPVKHGHGLPPRSSSSFRNFSAIPTNVQREFDLGSSRSEPGRSRLAATAPIFTPAPLSFTAESSPTWQTPLSNPIPIASASALPTQRRAYLFEHDDNTEDDDELLDLAFKVATAGHDEDQLSRSEKASTLPPPNPGSANQDALTSSIWSPATSFPGEPRGRPSKAFDWSWVP